jgi:serine phosphatase RsbU (regulator of sigma subunit)
MQEFESQKILAILARVHLDQELSLARHIEESLLPPVALEIGPYSIECYRQQGTQIGGHWFAVRPDGEGGLYALMCEASHQGIHGALILHAVQSLWAEDLGRSTIDPESWLHKANRALFVLGHSEVHELEVTLVHLSGPTMTYWGAGQRALFLLAENSGASPNIRLLSRNVLKLGLSEHIFPTAVKITLGPSDQVFLGNKGVFPGGDFCQPHDLMKTHQDLRTLSSRITPPATTEQGRSLVVISRRGVAAPLLRIRHA